MVHNVAHKLCRTHVRFISRHCQADRILSYRIRPALFSPSLSSIFFCAAPVADELLLLLHPAREVLLGSPSRISLPLQEACPRGSSNAVFTKCKFTSMVCCDLRLYYMLVSKSMAWCRSFADNNLLSAKRVTRGPVLWNKHMIQSKHMQFCLTVPAAPADDDCSIFGGVLYY